MTFGPWWRPGAVLTPGRLPAAATPRDISRSTIRICEVSDWRNRHAMEPVRSADSWRTTMKRAPLIVGFAGLAGLVGCGGSPSQPAAPDQAAAAAPAPAAAPAADTAPAAPDPALLAAVNG